MKKLFTIFFKWGYGIVLPTLLLYVCVKLYRYLLIQLNDKDDTLRLAIFDSDKQTILIIILYFFSLVYFFFKKIPINEIFTPKYLFKAIIIYLLGVNIVAFPFAFANMLHAWYENSILHSIIMLALIHFLMMQLTKLSKLENW